MVGDGIEQGRVGNQSPPAAGFAGQRGGSLRREGAISPAQPAIFSFSTTIRLLLSRCRREMLSKHHKREPGYAGFRSIASAVLTLRVNDLPPRIYLSNCLMYSQSPASMMAIAMRQSPSPMRRGHKKDGLLKCRTQAVQIKAGKESLRLGGEQIVSGSLG